ncbi:MAG: hypothetical protein A3A24_02525 [Candidatus Buchananbacteria bacterium RIFCSPLOWO2_01_FULL_46_12]|uniref:Type 4 secretion system PilS N-terminal domain-containing protein n=1 Tax=Candidatus Buchananbacteria bacterium RIFCSPLOWO2_01_FULL_46_12 TaxID=1797546 RepID=A0A1G1YN26_9BACT|nr:MAG: hypothetical protein A3A24_02525 [Candidatus Buchananbacteria bacterium RIFCSPLOWO2_01_FULL_46_12]
MEIIKNNKGQTLLEMVFAIGILIMVVTAILALSTSSIFGQKGSESQITANSLAREGIEVVRNIRDSNWLAGQAWDAGLVGPGSGLSSITAIPVFDHLANSWVLDFSADESTTVNIFGGVYNQQKVGVPVQGLTTPFRRLLTLYSICQLANGSQHQSIDCGADKKVGIKVEAAVNWLERGQPHQIKLESLLYDWK